MAGIRMRLCPRLCVSWHPLEWLAEAEAPNHRAELSISSGSEGSMRGGNEISTSPPSNSVEKPCKGKPPMAVVNGSQLTVVNYEWKRNLEWKSK